MESLRKRLNFSNPIFRLQVLRDLQKVVEEKLLRLEKSQQQHLLDKVPELDLLVNLVASDDEPLSTPSADIVFSLIFKKLLDSQAIIGKLVNSVANARDLTSVCRCLSRILVHKALEATMDTDLRPQQSRSTGGSSSRVHYHLPILVSERLHPFIVVLSSRSSAHCAILHEVDNMFNSTDIRVRSSALLVTGPFVKYVLLNPDFSASAARLGVQNIMAGQWAAGGDSSREFILHVIPAMPCDTQSDKSCMSDFVVQILRCALMTPCHTASASQLVRLFDLALSVCDRLGGAHASADVARAACVLLTERVAPLVASHDSTGCADGQPLLPTGFAPERCLLIAARLLLTSSPLSAEPLLDIVQILLTKLGWDSPPACLCSTLVLPILSITSLTTADAPASAPASKAIEVLQLIEAILSIPKEMAVTMANRSITPELPSAEVLAGQALGGEDYSDAAMAAVAGRLELEPDAALPWLCNLVCFTEQGGKLPASCILLLAAIVHWSSDEPTLIVALDAVVAACANQPEKAHGFIPLLLYKLRDDGTPAMHLALLTTLPRLASHKFTASVVVHALRSMAARLPRLRPIVLRLLTRLWQRHDRFFATLLDMLSSTADFGQQSVHDGDDEEDVTELAVSRAACAADVCYTRPHEHGPDVLPILSDILNHTCSVPRGELACSLALDGIRALCEKEVVNLKSVWAMLEPLLTRETRGSVLESVCRLLAVASSADVAGSQDFVDQAIVVLWDYALGQGGHHQPAPFPSVVGAAYRSLGAFPNELTTYKHLPPQVVRQYAPDAFLVDPETGATRLADGPVHGDCLVLGLLSLLSARDSTSRKGFSEFLAASMSREITNLPRSALSKYSHLRKGESAVPALPRVIESFPARLMMMYQAAIAGHKPQGQIANALLYCYNPRLADNEPGTTACVPGGLPVAAPKPRDLVIWMRMYEKALQGFICHVPPPSGAACDWQRSQQLPLAWQAFMTRMLNAMVVGRQAELSMQASKSSAVATAAGPHSTSRNDTTDPGGARSVEESPDSASDDDEAVAALHWSRSRLHDLIRTAGRQNAAVQANAMLAHAALCVALVKVGYPPGHGQLSARSDDSVVVAESRGRSWLRESFDALLAAADGSSSGGTAESAAAATTGSAESGRGGGTSSWWPLAQEWPCRGAACLALAYVAGALQSREAKRACRAVSLLGTLLLQCQDVQQESVCATALGQLLSMLFEHDLNEAVDVETATTVWKTLETFEDHCLELDASRGRKAGDGTAALPGLALCAGAIGGNQQSEVQAHCRRLLSRLLDAHCATAGAGSATSSDDRISMLCYCLAAAASPLMKRNAIALEESRKIVAVVVDGWSRSSKTNEAWAAAVGAIGWACNSAGCSILFPTVKDVVTQWEHVARSLDASKEQQSAAISGLMIVTGHDDWQRKAGTPEPTVSLHLASAEDIVSVFEPPMDGNKKPRKHGAEKRELRGEYCDLYWHLGRLHWAVATSADSLAADKRNGPASYRSLLPPSSILRSVVESLRTAVVHSPSSGAASSGRSGDTALLLRSLATAIAGRTVPPLDWLTLLSPFMHWPPDDDSACDDRTATHTCLEETCLKFAAEQALCSHACATFVARWCAPHLFKTLKPVCKNYLLRNFHRFCNALPRERAEEFMKRCCIPAVAEVRMPECTLVLQSCKDALVSCSSYTPGIQLLYYQAMEAVYVHLPAVVSCCDARRVVQPLQEELLQLYADCLLHMEDTFLEQLLPARHATDGGGTDAGDRWKRTYLRLLLVSLGRLPLTATVIGVDDVSNYLKQFPASWLLEHIAACFRGPHNHTERMDWLLKFSKDISLVLKSMTSLDQWSQALDGALCLFVAATAAWSGAMPWCLLVGPGGKHSPEATAAAAMPQLLVLLVGGAEPWSQLAPKIFEWLLDCSRLCMPPVWRASFSGDPPPLCTQALRAFASSFTAAAPMVVASQATKSANDSLSAVASIQGLRRCAFFHKQQLWERLPQVFSHE